MLCVTNVRAVLVGAGWCCHWGVHVSVFSARWCGFEGVGIYFSKRLVAPWRPTSAVISPFRFVGVLGKGWGRGLMCPITEFACSRLPSAAVSCRGRWGLPMCFLEVCGARVGVWSDDCVRPVCPGSDVLNSSCERFMASITGVGGASLVGYCIFRVGVWSGYCVRPIDLCDGVWKCLCTPQCGGG